MDKEYLINADPLKALVIFSLPMMLGNLFQQLYTMADSVIVGRFVGEKALASVGASYSLTTVFIAVAIGGGIGASVAASRAFGAREYGKMKEAIFTSLISFLAISIALAAFGWLASYRIMSALNTPADVIEDAVSYLRIYFLGMPFLFMYNVLSATFNALGRSKVPLFLLVFSSLLNVVLDIWMVASLEMGVEGAAWATLIAQGISAIVSFSVLMKVLRGYEGRPERLWSGSLLLSMSRIALPSILQQSTVSIGMMLVQSVVNSFGSEVLAGFSAAMRVESFVVVPMSAMGNAMSSYTAQNLGAGRKDRVVQGYHAAYMVVIAFAVLICLLLETSHDAIISLFIGSSGTAAAMAAGTGYLTFMGWFFALIGFKMSTDGLLRGAGDMTMFTVANLVNLSIRVAFAFAFAPRYGVEMVWAAVPIGWAANWLISGLEYRRGRWRR